MRVENWPLMEKVIRRIKADPDSWNQSMWATARTECGTAYCVAGYAVVESGYEFLRDETGRLVEQFVVVPQGSTLRHLAVAPRPDLPAVPLAYPADAGQELLGITTAGRFQLFASKNTFPEILAIIEDWATVDGYDWPADLRLTPEQRAIVDAYDSEDFFGEIALMDLQEELLSSTAPMEGSR